MLFFNTNQSRLSRSDKTTTMAVKTLGGTGVICRASIKISI